MACCAVLRCVLLLQDDAIRNLFSAQTKSEYSVSTLLTFSTMFFVLAVLSYGEGCVCVFVDFADT